jgi:hypothetical protein
MIMPFSESLYKKWWTEFWKWMFMGPMAVVIIAIGATIAGSGAPTVIEPNGVSSTNNLIKLLILAGAVYFAGTLPKQWGGSVMASFQGAGKKMWGATGGALGKWAYDRTAGRYVVGRTKSFLALRKQKRDDADRLAVSGAMSKIAGPNEKGRLANFVAGNRIFDKDIQKAQRQADYLKHQADINKTYMVDQLNEQEVKGRRDDILRRKGALGEHETLEDLKSDPARLDKAVNALLSEPEGIAYFKHIAAKGWTDNSVGSFDQRTFHALNAMDRNIAELVRQGNRGFMMNTGDPVMVKTAMDDASKRSPGDYSHQEMERYVALAREGAKRSWTDKEREDRYKELGGKVGRGEKLSSEEFKEFSEAGALSLTKALTDAGLTEMAKKSPQAYSEATKAAAATPAIFSEGAQQHFTAPATPAATPPAGPTPGAGPNDSSML